MDSTGWMLLVAATLIFAGLVLWWIRRVKPAQKSATTPTEPRERRRGPRRVKASRREAFRMGKEDSDRRLGEDRRHRTPGWSDDADKR